MRQSVPMVVLKKDLGSLTSTYSIMCDTAQTLQISTVSKLEWVQLKGYKKTSVMHGNGGIDGIIHPVILL